MNTITIDCGASYIKGALFVNGEKCKSISQSSPKVHSERNLFAPTQIVSLSRIVKSMILNLAQGEDEVKLCICNEMHGFLLADKTGKPITDYISWQMELGNELIGGKTSRYIITEDLQLFDDITLSGMALRAGLPSSNLCYLIHKFPMLELENSFFYTLGDYLIKSFSCEEPYIHPTNAAATGLYNLETGNWNQKYLVAIGADKIKFPKIGFERICFELDGIKFHVLPAIGDQQAALLGAGFGGEKSISFNLGTGAQVSRLVKTIDFTSNVQIRPYFKGMYLKTIPHIPSGRALNVYIHFIQSILKEFELGDAEEQMIWEKVLRQLEKPILNNELECGLYFFENPISNCQSGFINNVTENNFEFGNLSIAVFNNFIDNFIQVADQIFADKLEVEDVFFSGGVAKKIRFVRDKIASFYPNAQIHIATDETLLGLYQYGELVDEN